MSKTPKVPHVLAQRADDVGVEATQEWAIEEAKYVIEMISEGGSNYNDGPGEGKSELRDCKQYLKRCGV